jgi:biotin operon repressor
MTNTYARTMCHAAAAECRGTIDPAAPQSRSWPVLDLFGAGAFRVALSALKLGLFDALAQEPLSGEELAQRLGLHEQAATTLLATLQAFGYVKRTRHGRYVNTPMTAKWLLSDSPSHLADFLTWWQQLVFTFWDQYFEVVMRDGRPPLTIYEWLESQPDGWNVAQAGFEATARLIVEEVVAKIALPRRGTRVLDERAAAAHWNR